MRVAFAASKLVSQEIPTWFEIHLALLGFDCFLPSFLVAVMLTPKLLRTGLFLLELLSVSCGIKNRDAKSA